jgi:hypothetical protein
MSDYWRVGRRVPKNVYCNEEIAGQFQCEEWARQAADALNSRLPEHAWDDVPCSMCSFPAMGIFVLPKGCSARPEQIVQPLCRHHWINATPVSAMYCIALRPGELK